MVMRRRSSHRYPHDIQPIIRLWLLRMLVPLGAKDEFIRNHAFANDVLPKLLGLDEWVDRDFDDFNRKAIISELIKLHKEAERNLLKATPPVILMRNVRQLADMVGLSTTDCRVLEFAIIIHNDSVLDDTADWLGNLSKDKLIHVLSVLLDLPEAEIRSALSTKGILNQSGLLTVNQDAGNTVKGKLELLSSSFSQTISSMESDLIYLLRDIVLVSPPPQLEITDYVHVSKSIDILLPYLRRVLIEKGKGVNIFIYGSPGTGKTQLARVLAKECQCNLFEVSSEDEDGDQVDGTGRLRALRAAQCFLAQSSSMLIFDEAEDVFNGGGVSLSWLRSPAQAHKGWFNAILENNPIPTFWLSNAIDGLDPAFIRRFDMIFELPIPPRKQRERILNDICGHMLDAQTISNCSESEVLAPAVVARVALVVSSIRDEIGRAASATAIDHMIGNTLEAQGHKPIRRNDPSRLPEVYDPAFIQADSDLAQIVTGLARSKSGRLCLYGPPGTGKTAYGRWLAEQLEVPLLVKRASDLLSKWLGESEQNIAKSFRQAEQEGALLMIDEVDSFLQDRRGAQYSWEVSKVNEMLTQMESFSGIFIASTNLMDGLDQATLRRFDLKVKFDYLKSDQAWILFQRYCKVLEFPVPSAELKVRLKKRMNLTPGDFAAVMRQHRFRPVESSSALVAALEAECAMKEGSKTAIGFV